MTCYIMILTGSSFLQWQRSYFDSFGNEFIFCSIILRQRRYISGRNRTIVCSLVISILRHTAFCPKNNSKQQLSINIWSTSPQLTLVESFCAYTLLLKCLFTIRIILTIWQCAFCRRLKSKVFFKSILFFYSAFMQIDFFLLNGHFNMRILKFRSTP